MLAEMTGKPGTADDLEWRKTAGGRNRSN